MIHKYFDHALIYVISPISIWGTSLHKQDHVLCIHPGKPKDDVLYHTNEVHVMAVQQQACEIHANPTTVRFCWNARG